PFTLRSENKKQRCTLRGATKHIGWLQLGYHFGKLGLLKINGLSGQLWIRSLASGDAWERVRITMLRVGTQQDPATNIRHAMCKQGCNERKHGNAFADC